MTEPTTNGVVPAVKATQVHKAFGSLHVLKGVDMTVMPGSVTVILGPSGSGKSTFLRLINQLETLTGGEIDVDGEMIGYKYVDKDGKQVLQTLNDKEVAEQRSKLGMVFQRFNLFPHMTALENVMEAPVHVKHMDKKEARKLAIEELNRVGMGDRLDHYPAQLSGGQQQRVAIARALVKMPRVLLLDEPLSNLDARLRLQTREEIRRIQKETGITTVFVTHDQEEAMSISDMIVVMKLGVVQQIGKPQEVYDDPANLFVANFLGTPPINVFSGRVEGGKLFIGDDCVLTVGGLEDQEVTVGIRPEGFILDENGPLTCQLNNVEVMGRDVSVVSTHAASLKPSVRSIIDADDRSGLNGEVVRYSVKPHKLFVFHKETEKRLAFEVK